MYLKITQESTVGIFLTEQKWKENTYESSSEKTPLKFTSALSLGTSRYISQQASFSFSFNSIKIVNIYLFRETEQNRKIVYMPHEYLDLFLKIGHGFPQHGIFHESKPRICTV